ncbi:immunoglobulin-like domain-containing protein, partial [Bacillus paramycoides]|uniref:immunoglobulin-like domain-containing protein n=1 Tax=Bacillus paramycoides TaxID=2026194 RepID=UPI003CFF3870
TDNKFDTIKDTTNQKAIDEAKAAVTQLPPGEEKSRLQQLVVKANDLLAISKITIDVKPMVVGDTTVNGTNSPETTRVYIYLNDQLVRYRNVEADGTFFGHVSNRLKAGDVIRVVPFDAKGRQGKAMEITVEKSQALEAPNLHQYTEGAPYLNGTVASGTSYVRIYVNGTHIRKRNVEANGVDLKAYLLDAGAKTGDTVTVVPYNENDVKGKEKTITVQAPPVELKTYIEGDEQLFGQTIKAADKVDIYVNEKFLRTRAIDKATGKFYGSMRSTETGLPKAGDVIKVIARTDKGVVQTQSELTVETAVDFGGPTVNEWTASSERITGTVPQGAKKVRLYYGAGFKNVLNRGPIDPIDQSFIMYVKDLNLKPGDQVKVVAINEIGRESQPTLVTVK